MIPTADRLDATGPTELLLTETPEGLHRMQEWARIRGVELVDGAVHDGVVTMVVRAALLHELAAKVEAKA